MLENFRNFFVKKKNSTGVSPPVFSLEGGGGKIFLVGGEGEMPLLPPPNDETAPSLEKCSPLLLLRLFWTYAESNCFTALKFDSELEICFDAPLIALRMGEGVMLPG